MTDRSRSLLVAVVTVTAAAVALAVGGWLPAVLALVPGAVAWMVGRAGPSAAVVEVEEIAVSEPEPVVEEVVEPEPSLAERIVEGSPLGCFAADETGATLYANAAARQLVPGIESIASLDGWSPLIHPEDMSAVTAEYRTWTGRDRTDTATLAFRSADGSTWFRLRLSKVSDGLIAGTVTDATGEIESARTSAEAATARLHKQVTAAQTSLARAIGDGLETPMHRLTEILENVADTKQYLSNDERTALLTVAGELVRELQIHVSDLQFAGRPEEAARATALVPSNPFAVAQRLAHRSTLAGLGQIEVTGTEDSALLHPERLEQVLQQLVFNAFQNGARRVTVDTSADEKWVQVTVTDDGDGVPARLRDEIFQPFVTTRDTGTGVGLSTSRLVAEAAGGTLTLDPAAGRGATFRLRLRRAEAAVTAA